MNTRDFLWLLNLLLDIIWRASKCNLNNVNSMKYYLSWTVV